MPIALLLNNSLNKNKMNKEEHINLDGFGKTLKICSVIESCKTKEQLLIAFVWGNNVLNVHYKLRWTKIHNHYVEPYNGWYNDACKKIRNSYEKTLKLLENEQ